MYVCVRSSRTSRLSRTNLRTGSERTTIVLLMVIGIRYENRNVEPVGPTLRVLRSADQMSILDPLRTHRQAGHRLESEKKASSSLFASQPYTECATAKVGNDRSGRTGATTGVVSAAA